MVDAKGCTEPVLFKFDDPFFLDFEKPHGFLAYALLIIIHIQVIYKW